MNLHTDNLPLATPSAPPHHYTPLELMLLTVPPVAQPPSVRTRAGRIFLANAHLPNLTLRAYLEPCSSAFIQRQRALAPKPINLHRALATYQTYAQLANTRYSGPLLNDSIHYLQASIQHYCASRPHERPTKLGAHLDAMLRAKLVPPVEQ